MLGDFQGELDDFRPVPAATSPLRSPEALLAKLRAVRLKRGLGIAELQALGDVNGDGRLTAVELGKVFAAASWMRVVVPIVSPETLFVRASTFAVVMKQNTYRSQLGVYIFVLKPCRSNTSPEF